MATGLHHSDLLTGESAANSVVSRHLPAAAPTALLGHFCHGYPASELLPARDGAQKGTRSRPLSDVDFLMGKLFSGAAISRADGLRAALQARRLLSQSSFLPFCPSQIRIRGIKALLAYSCSLSPFSFIGIFSICVSAS